MNIFISIASFCDPVLFFTLKQAVSKAKYPRRLHFGIVDQNYPNARRVTPEDVYPAKLSVINMDFLQARGPCFARATAMGLYNNEEWFFQIDAHMDFKLNWDTYLVEQFNFLPKQKAVISAYPPSFAFTENNDITYSNNEEGVLGQVVNPHYKQFDQGNLSLGFVSQHKKSTTPIEGFSLGAGCIFGPGYFADNFPYDPHFYFQGEEQALALRLFTHGWTIFHIPNLPLAHLYNGGGVRKMHWDAEFESERKLSWVELEHKSRERLSNLAQPGIDLCGVYSLGRVRTLKDYADFSGIDYVNKVIWDKAYQLKN